MSEISTKPYMLRAIHEWCTDSGFTPYIAVSVDERTLVPPDFVRAGEIVLNISSSATNRLEISNELIQFQARFNGQAQDLSIPVDNVSAIYARENGHGMAFEVPRSMTLVDEQGADDPAMRLVPAESEGQAQPAGEDPAPRQRPTLAAVPGKSSAGSDQDNSSDDDPGPDDDGTSGSADNGAGTPPKPRGKPRLTRVK